MKILFIGFAESIHLTRWVNQLDGTDWELYLFPANPGRPHADLLRLNYFNNSVIPGRKTNKKLNYKHWTLPYFAMDYVAGLLRKLGSSAPLQSLFPTTFRVKALAKTIKLIQPDIIHSLEIQHAGYLVLEAKKLLKQPFPNWIVTNWGSDIYLFGRLASHRDKVRAVLENCDYYSCECERDIRLAQDLGLRGQTLPVFPNTGGFDLSNIKTLRNTVQASQRKTILLKGYQQWSGRALFGLRALARCSDILRAGGYQIAIYSAVPDVELAAEIFEQDTGIPVTIIPYCSHDEMLKWYACARIYIGLSISDAISTSLLEAMVMGAFPIQSGTACADEWIADGRSGLIVPPEDVEVIEAAIRCALGDDDLVDSAAIANWNTAQNRLDSTVIHPQVIAAYERVYNSRQEQR